MKDKQLTFVLILLAILASMALYLFLMAKGLDLNKIQFNFNLTRQKDTADETKYPNKITITSTAFANDSEIPSKYTCTDVDISPPLNITAVPAGTKSLAIVVEDPDAPYKTWTHWILHNLDPRTRQIYEGRIPFGTIPGENDYGVAEYRGPCPPTGTHRYIFRVYALDSKLNLDRGADRKEFDDVIDGHVLDVGELVGRYEKK